MMTADSNPSFFSCQPLPLTSTGMFEGMYEDLTSLYWAQHSQSRQESGHYTNEPLLHGQVNPECPGATGSRGTLARLQSTH